MKDLAEHKKVLESMAELIEQEKICAKVVDAGNEGWINELDEQLRKTGERFTVQIVGIFNAGKSSFVNAILGEDLLPTGNLPETGVLTEFVYGEQKSITLYPKKGRLASDDPIVLTDMSAKAISEYTSIDNQSLLEGDDDRATSDFEKMVITWPLDMLKNGVMLVDSVGLDDVWGNDAITKSYFPRDDAMIFLINASGQPFSGRERDVLTEINDFGISNVVFGVTHMGLVAYNIRNHADPENEMAEFKDTLRKHCEQYTDLGSEAIHFVDSLDALDGKRQMRVDPANGQKLLVGSGFSEMEQYLSDYLVSRKGQDQIRNIATVMRNKARLIRSSAEAQDKTSLMDKDKFNAMISEQEMRIQLARQQRDNISQGFRGALRNTYKNLDDMLDQFLKELPDKVDLEDYTPRTQFLTGKAALNPIRSRQVSKSFAEEAQNELKKRTERLLRQWIDNTAVPFMEAEVNKASESVHPEVNSFDDLLSSVDSALTGKPVSQNAGLTQIFLSYAGFGPFSGLVSALYGKDVAGNVLKGNAAVWAGWTLLAFLGAPLSVPAFVIGIIVADLLAIVAPSQEGRARRAKQSVLKNYRRYLREDLVRQNRETGKTPSDEMKNGLHKMLDDICDEMDRMLDSDLENITEQMRQAIQNYKLDIQQRADQVKARSEAIADLDKVLAQVDDIEKQYGVA